MFLFICAGAKGGEKNEIQEEACRDRSLLDGHMHVYGCTIMIPGGRVHAKVGDYIIRGVYGELYPCDPRIFCMTHEKVG